MDNPQGKIQLSQDDVKRILALPKREVKLGSTIRYGYFDADASKLYQCDNEGNLTGQVVKIAAKPVAPSPSTTPAADTPTPKPDEKKGEPEEKPVSKLTGLFNKKKDAPAEKEAEKEPAAPAPMAGPSSRLVALVLVFSLASTVLSGLTFMAASRMAANPGTEDPTITDGQKVSVVQLARTLIPGQQIIETDLQMAELDSNSVQEFAMFDHYLCTWDKAELLIGSYANEYMTAGHYLELTDVTSSHPSTQTPWEADAGTQWTIEMDEHSKEDYALSFGSVIAAEIRATFNNQVAGGDINNGSAPVTGDGIVHTTTTSEVSRVDEYSLQQLVVVDILNANKESLYPTYKAYSGIPVSERRDYIAKAMRDDPELEARLTPCYVVLRLLDSQVPVISQIETADSNQVLLRTTTEAEQNTTEKRAESVGLQGIRDVIQLASSYNAQLKAEQEAAASQQQQDKQGE